MGGGRRGREDFVKHRSLGVDVAGFSSGVTGILGRRLPKPLRKNEYVHPEFERLWLGLSQQSEMRLQR